MSDSPFFQFYPSDWLAGTRGLTAAETGIYITLVAMMYEANGPVPADIKRLSRLCGSTATAFKKCIDGLIETGKLTLDERGFFNHRVGIEIEKRNKKRSSATENINARWLKTKEKQEQVDTDVSNPKYETDTIQKPESIESFSSDKSSEKAATAAPDKPLFDLGRRLLGQKAGGMVTSLRKRYPDGEVMRLLEVAATKSNPREYIGRIVAGEAVVTASIFAAQQREEYRRMGVDLD